jgi:hypothetical protein
VFGLPGADGADLDKLVSILAGIRRRAGDFDDEGASGW